jgi:DNA gyrase inhibitor GyrI
VDETVQADDLVSIVDFPGGFYAVFRVEVNDPYKDIGPAWQTLVKWMENSKYSHGTHQWLEEHIGPLEGVVNQVPFTLDLHLPIKR